MGNEIQVDVMLSQIDSLKATVYVTIQMASRPMPVSGLKVIGNELGKTWVGTLGMEYRAWDWCWFHKMLELTKIAIKVAIQGVLGAFK